MIGEIFKKIHSPYFIKTGEYKKENLPHLVEKYKLDIIFISSICPETFSYTTQEAIDMNIPVACFNLGAPAERVKKYEKGLIIDRIDSEYALNKIINYINKIAEYNMYK